MNTLKALCLALNKMKLHTGAMLVVVVVVVVNLTETIIRG